MSRYLHDPHSLMKGMEILCALATTPNHLLNAGTQSWLLNINLYKWMDSAALYIPVCLGEWLGMQKPVPNSQWPFLLTSEMIEAPQ